MPAPPSPRTPEWPPRSAPRLFVPGPLVAGEAVILGGNQAHYLNRVMRAKEGDIVVCMGAGDITYWAYALPDELTALQKNAKGNAA